MKHALLTIDAGINLGNRLIEYALSSVLDLPAPAVVASMFSPISDEEAEQINDCDFLLLPGSTILADGAGNSEALHSLQKITVPIYCTAASGWANRFEYHSKEVLERITGPIGARDTHTLEHLEGLGLPAILVGCPTVYMPRIECDRDGYTVVGFGRVYAMWQQSRFAALPLALVAVQEKAFCQRLAEEIGLCWFDYASPVEVYLQYAKAEACVTGRLHGILPAMSQGCEVAMFGEVDGWFGDRYDSRLSLLRYLGIDVTPYGEPIKTFAPMYYQPQVDELHKNLLAWRDQTIANHQNA